MNSFIICDREGIQDDGSVAFNGDNYIVVWSDFGLQYLAAARVTPQGAVLDTGNYVGFIGYFSDMSFDGNHCFVVEWIYQYTGIHGIRGWFIDSSAQAVSSMIEIAETGGESSNYIRPRIEFDNDNYLVVWADYRAGGDDNDVYGQFVSPQGQLIGPKIMVATGQAEQVDPHLAFDGSNYLIVWSEGTQINGQRLTTDGQFIGPNFQISENTLYNRSSPGIGASNNGFLVTWSEEHGIYTDIYGNVDVQTEINETDSPSHVFFVLQNKPNPFSHTTDIRWQIIDGSSESSITEIDLRIFDATGRLVKDFSPHTSNFPLPTSVSWDGTNDHGQQLPAGIYFVKMEASDFEATRKILLLR